MLTVLASALLVGAYLFYIRALKQGEIPHPVTIATWLVWVLLNWFTYIQFTRIAASVFPTVQLVCICILSMQTTLTIRRIGWEAARHATSFSRWDIVVGIAVLVAVGYTFGTTNPIHANLATQAAVVLSFAPMTKMAFAGRQSMIHWPWSLGVAAYTCQLMIARQDGWAACAYPGINILGHSAVWLGVIAAELRTSRLP